MSPHDKAQQGLQLLKDAVLELLAVKSSGLTNAEVARDLGIKSDYLGGQQDYLSWSVLGLLLNTGAVERQGRRYLLTHGDKK